MKSVVMSSCRHKTTEVEVIKFLLYLSSSCLEMDIYVQCWLSNCMSPRRTTHSGVLITIQKTYNAYSFLHL